MRRPILSFDLDNVIRDSIGAIINLSRQRYNRELNRAMFNQWDPKLGQHLGIPEAEFFQFAWLDPAVSRLALPVKGAAEVLQELESKAFIIINTNNPHKDITYEWLQLWRIPHHAVEHTSDKAKVNFDVHVDDCPSVLEQLSSAGRHVIRFSVPWNNHMNGLCSVAADWQQLRQLLDGYLHS